MQHQEEDGSNCLSKDQLRSANQIQLLKTVQKLNPKQQKLAVKLTRTQGKFKKRMLQPALMCTISRITQHHSSLPLQDQKQLLQDLSSTLFILLARISSINSQPMRYTFNCRDQTIGSEVIQLFMGKNHSSGLKTFYSNKEKQGKGQRNVSVEQIGSLQFQPNSKEGQPYYKFFIKIGSELISKTKTENPKQTKLIWSIQKLQRVPDLNELSFHCLNIMMKQRSNSFQ